MGTDVHLSRSGIYFLMDRMAASEAGILLSKIVESLSVDLYRMVRLRLLLGRFSRLRLKLQAFLQRELR